MGRNIPPVQDLQQKLTDLQARVVVPLDQLNDINKRMNEGEASSRAAKKEMIEATGVEIDVASFDFHEEHIAGLVDHYDVNFAVLFFLTGASGPLDAVEQRVSV